jgi:hypothetical protein
MSWGSQGGARGEDVGHCVPGVGVLLPIPVLWSSVTTGAEALVRIERFICDEGEGENQESSLCR